MGFFSLHWFSDWCVLLLINIYRVILLYSDFSQTLLLLINLRNCCFAYIVMLINFLKVSGQPHCNSSNLLSFCTSSKDRKIGSGHRFIHLQLIRHRGSRNYYLKTEMFVKNYLLIHQKTILNICSWFLSQKCSWSCRLFNTDRYYVHMERLAVSD